MFDATWPFFPDKLAVILGERLQSCYSQISWMGTAWNMLKWGLRLGILGLFLHYCWYQFVWKRLTRIPDDVARQTMLSRPKPAVIGNSIGIKGELTYKMKRERLSRISQVGEFLEDLEIFGYLEAGVRDILKSMAREVFVKRGEPVVSGGGNLDVFILKQGRVKVTSSAGDNQQQQLQQPMELMVTLPGFIVTSLFKIAVALTTKTGEDKIEDSFARISAVAEEDSVCVMIPLEAFEQIKERGPLQTKQILQVLFARFQRITCSGLLHHLGLLDDLAEVEFAATDCTSSVASALLSKESENQCLGEVYSMECLEDVQRKGVKKILGALKIIENSDVVLESIDMAYEAKVECVIADQPISNESVYYVSSGVVIVSSTASSSVRYVATGGCLVASSVVLGGRCQFQFRAMTNCVLVRLDRHSILRLFERCPNAYGSLVRLLFPRINGFLAFVDLGLNWIHLDAGTPICFQNDDVGAFYIVVHGRLRSVRRRPLKGDNGEVDRVIEVGCGGSLGEMEIMNGTCWPGTIFAIRDSELVRVPRDLFEFLLRARPSVTSRLAKALAVQIPSPFYSADQQQSVPMGMFGRGPRQDIKTLTILPLSSRYMSLAENFCTRLFKAISVTDSVAILTKASVLDALGRHAFTAYGKLRLLEWLNGLEDQNRIVIYFAGDLPNSPWTKQCIRQADCVFIVADARGDGLLREEAAAEEIGEYERAFLALSNRPKIELVLVHPTHHCASGLTKTWLKPRPWISQHHHVMMPCAASSAPGPDCSPKKRRSHICSHLWNSPYNVDEQLLSTPFFFKFRRPNRKEEEDYDNDEQGYRGEGSEDENNLSDEKGDRYSSRDIGRLARRVLGTSVGLVLGGGGARGISHVSIIKALLEAGIPIDIVGGTSIGALVGGLYCRDANEDTCQALLLSASELLSSKWRLAYDLTYPFCAWFTGEFFNRGMWKIFGRRFIEDMWIPFFCVSTDITLSKMRVHREGFGWRSIRASMSLSGFLPPIWDSGDDTADGVTTPGGSLLLDGGYVNNLPADVMYRDYDHVRTVIAIDVASERSRSDEFIEDELSGTWLFLKSLLGLRMRVPNLADIQSRLAYVSSAEGTRLVKKAAEDPASRMHYLRPPVQQFGTLDFGQFSTILKIGEAYGRGVVRQWSVDGTLLRIKGGSDAVTVNNRATIDDPASFPATAGRHLNDSDSEQKRKTLHRRRRSL